MRWNGVVGNGIRVKERDGGEKYYNTRNRPEWPLVKLSKITGSAFPVSAAMRDFHEPVTWLVEQGIRFGPVFHSTGLPAIGSERHQIAGQTVQQILPEMAAHLLVAGLSQGGAVLAQRVHRAFEADPFEVRVGTRHRLGDDATD